MTQNTPSLDDANTVIKAFGGIRPMANKLGVPVTTVQGWKKRNQFPESRRNEIRQAMQDNHIAASVQPTPPETPQVHIQPQTATPLIDEKVIIMNAKKQATKQAFLIVVVALSICAFLISMFLVPAAQDVEELKNEVSALKKRNYSLSSVIPKDVQDQIETLQQSTTQMKILLNDLSRRASSGAMGILDESSLNTRFEGLEEEINILSNLLEGQDLGALSQRLDSLTTQSQTMIKDQPFTSEELQAGIMLLALAQFRESVARDVPFDDDLAVLKQMTGPDDPALNAAFEKLTPYARQGILNPQEISNQLAGMRDELIAAGLRGEDLSIKDRAMARLNGLISVEKDGETLNATRTERLIAQAQAQLDENNIEGALATLQALEGEPAQDIGSLLGHMEANLLVKHVKTIMTRDVLNRLTGSATPIDIRGALQKQQDEQAQEQEIPTQDIPVYIDDGLDIQ